MFKKLKMFKLINRKIGIKTAILTNTVLFVIILVGGWVLVEQQCTRLETTLFLRGQTESMIGAAVITTLLEEAVDNGVFSINDVFDTKYQVIPGFEPAKYHTVYDAYFDKAAIDLQDSFLKNTDNIYAIAVDINGYCPSHNSVFQKAPVGDPEIDKAGNRTKRIFNDAIGIKAAINIDTGFRQSYQKDTGEQIWDISSPVYVRGKHWGAFRIGISLEKIALAKTSLMKSLAFIMFCIMAISMLSVFLIVNYYIKPLDQLKKSAYAIADGQIDEALSVNIRDEVGLVTESIERLRISLKHMMKRMETEKR